jgi:hypothetical protein
MITGFRRLMAMHGWRRVLLPPAAGFVYGICFGLIFS